MKSSNGPQKRWHPVNTHLGPFLVELDGEGRLAALRFPIKKSFPPQPGARKMGSALRRLEKSIQNYLAGKKTTWDFPLNLSEGTAFQQKVWQKLRQIPHGETRTYGWVAAQIGRPKAARAVGGACSQNPIPILVPCHRVLGAGEKLTGFSSGLAWKRRLLHLEKSQKHAKIKLRMSD